MQLIEKFSIPATDHLLTEKETANFLGCSARTIQRWRMTGEGPSYRRMGVRRVVYSRADLMTYLARRTFTSTSAEGYRRSRKEVTKAA